MVPGPDLRIFLHSCRLGVGQGAFCLRRPPAPWCWRVVSITQNPLLFKAWSRCALLKSVFRPGPASPRRGELPVFPANTRGGVGYGPGGPLALRILRENGIVPVVVGTEPGHRARAARTGSRVVNGDAGPTVKYSARGLQSANAFPHHPGRRPGAGIHLGRPRVNPDIRVFIHTTYLREAESCSGRAARCFGEGEVAQSMSLLMRDWGPPTQVDRERRRNRWEQPARPRASAAPSVEPLPGVRRRSACGPAGSRVTIRQPRPGPHGLRAPIPCGETPAARARSASGPAGIPPHGCRARGTHG